MGVGAVVSGIFGMNLHNALETHPYAFLIGKCSALGWSINEILWDIESKTFRNRFIIYCLKYVLYCIDVNHNADKEKLA